MKKHISGMVVFWSCTLAVILPASADVYRTVDKDGNVVFTDVPPREDSGATRVVIPPVNTGSLSTGATGQPDETTNDADDFIYELANIVSPRDDEAVRGNVGDMRVDIDVYPTLQPGHEVQLYLDGKAILAGRELSYQLDNVERGTHTLHLEIVDASGKVLFAGAPSTFHLQRYAIPTAPNQVQPLPTPVNPPATTAPRRRPG